MNGMRIQGENDFLNTTLATSAHSIYFSIVKFFQHLLTIVS